MGRGWVLWGEAGWWERGFFVNYQRDLVPENFGSVFGWTPSRIGCDSATQFRFSGLPKWILPNKTLRCLKGLFFLLPSATLCNFSKRWHQNILPVTETLHAAVSSLFRV